jgi:hypothetical protein
MHHMNVDSKGNLYVTEVQDGKRVQKFVFKGMVPVPTHYIRSGVRRRRNRPAARALAVNFTPRFPPSFLPPALAAASAAFLIRLRFDFLIFPRAEIGTHSARLGCARRNRGRKIAPISRCPSAVGNEVPEFRKVKQLQRLEQCGQFATTGGKKSE